MKTDEEKQLEPVDRSKGQWYVLQTGTGRENKVKEAIEGKLLQDPGAVPRFFGEIPKISNIGRGVLTKPPGCATMVAIHQGEL